MNKNLLTTFIAILCFTAAFSQEQTKLNYSLVKKILETNDPMRPAGLFVQGNIETIRTLTESLGGRFKYASGNIASIVLPVSKVNDLAGSPDVWLVEDNYMKLQPMCDSLLSKNNVYPVHLGVTPLPQGYDGTGVVVGILDSGIDFNHPDYKDASNNTRIKFIWDHNLPLGPNTPIPYNYGQEFTSAMIDGGQANAHVDNYFGHGTHVSGVATGDGSAINKFKGVAPNADIISVCFNWNLNDDDWLSSVADAVEYVYDKADGLGKPCVINISAGTYYGSHDAKDLQAQLINNLITAQAGRSLVAAAGNAGSLKIHMQYDNLAGNTDTVFTWFNTNPNPIYMEMWAEQTQFPLVRFSIGADKVTPDYEFRGQRPFTGISNHLGIFKTDTLYSVNGNRLALIQSYGSFSSGRYSMIFNVIADSTMYNYRLSLKGTGKCDLWSFQMVSTGLPAVGTFPPIAKYLSPDLNQTIVSSFTCSDKVITVAEYINKENYIDCVMNPQSLPILPDSLSVNSSHGPTRLGLTKPDIAGAGGIAFAPRVTYTPINNAATAEGCMHIRDGGTSTASPGVAGIAALYLQRYPTATWSDVKNAILGCCRHDNYTGASGFPKNDWGCGKADAWLTMNNCFVGIDENMLSDADFFVSPNPFSNQTTIMYDLTGKKFNSVEIKIYDIAGKEVRNIPVEKTKGEIMLFKKDLGAGIYFLNVVSENEIMKKIKLAVL